MACNAATCDENFYKDNQTEKKYNTKHFSLTCDFQEKNHGQYQKNSIILQSSLSTNAVIYRNEVFTSLHVYIWRVHKSDWLNYACFEQQWLFFSVFSCWCFAQVAATLHNGRFPFNRKIRNFWIKRTIQPKIPEIPVRKSMERKFPGTFFENFGIPQEVVLFMGKVCKLTTFYSAEVSFGHDHSELDIPVKDAG